MLLFFLTVYSFAATNVGLKVPNIWPNVEELRIEDDWTILIWSMIRAKYSNSELNNKQII